MTYELSSTDRLSKMALQLYDSIIEKFKTSEDYRWPTPAGDLEDQGDILPPDLKKCLTIIIPGNESDSNTAKENRLVLSLGQDLCRSDRNGLWKLPFFAYFAMHEIAAYVQKCRTHNINQSPGSFRKLFIFFGA